MSAGKRSQDQKPEARPDVRKDEWTQAREKGRDAVGSVGSMANHAGSAVATMATEAVGDVGCKADDLAANAGAGIKDLGDRLSKGGPQSGVLGTASRAVGQAVHDGGEYVQNARLSGMGKDIAELVRQNPLPAVGIALGLGWLLASRSRN